MTLQDFAHVAISGSAIVALLTFLATQWDRFKNNRNEEVRKWQSVLVYSILDKYGELSFDEIKSYYLQSAQQSLSLNIPKKEIQDEALLRILIGLLENRIVFYTVNRTYDLDLARPDNREEMNKTMMELVTKKEELSTLVPEIYDSLEKSTTKFTSDSLYRHLTEENSRNVNYHQYLGALILMERQGSIARKEDGVLVAMKRVIKDSKNTPNKAMQSTAKSGG